MAPSILQVPGALEVAVEFNSLSKTYNMAATIYQALGLPKTIAWKDALDRPHHVYHGEPIRGLC